VPNPITRHEIYETQPECSQMNTNFFVPANLVQASLIRKLEGNALISLRAKEPGHPYKTNTQNPPRWSSNSHESALCF
jgi:hypothetical protein